MTSPKVSIIITSYCPESKPYLDLCIRSIKNLSYENFETILVTRPGYAPEFNGVLTVFPDKQEFWNSTGLNHGVKCARTDSEYYFLINDDVILTRDCLQPLVATLQERAIGQVMPIGNDMQGKYFFPQLACKLNLEMALASEHLLKNARSNFEPGMILAETLCLYAQLISKRVWEDVGPFDENLTGQDDIDYSLRVRQKGYINAIELSSLVWHFGGVSAALTLTDEKRKDAMERFNKKWSDAIQK